MTPSTENKLAIICWLWGDKYSEQHVNVLYRAVKEHLKLPFKFICITDRTSNDQMALFDSGIWIHPIWDDFSEYGLQYRRLRLLHDDSREIFGPRILQLDLEMFILKDFTHWITNDAFKIWKCPASSERGFMYNTSVMLMEAGWLHHVWNKFNINPLKEIHLKQKNMWVGTDQAIISNYVHPAKFWCNLDGLYSYKVHIEKAGLSKPPEDAVMVGMYGKAYDPVLKLDVPWVKEYWHSYLEQVPEHERRRLLEGTWEIYDTNNKSN